MATKILSAKADIALLAKLTAEANVAKQQRKLDLLIKTELLRIANAINDAANKGETEINFALSASVKKLEDLSAIETEFTEQGYTFEKAYNRSNVFTGYIIKWPAEDDEEEETPGEVTPDPVDPTPDPDPVTPDPVTPDPDPEQQTPAYTYTAVTEDQLIENAENSPVELGWYEEDGENAGEYVLTQDEHIIENKAYFIRSEVTE